MDYVFELRIVALSRSAKTRIGTMDYVFGNVEALATYFRERASRCQKLRQYAKTCKASAALDVERATWVNAAHIIEHTVFRVNHDTQGDVTSTSTSL